MASLHSEVEIWREDPYAERYPGKLVIWSFDSIGTYRLEYWDGKEKSKLSQDRK